MSSREYFDQMFTQLETLDARAFAERFTEGGVFRLGNLDPVHGKGAIEQFAGGFFSAISGIHHGVDNCWTIGDRAITSGTVTYTRKDGSSLSVPFAVIARFEGEKLAEFQTYADASKLFAP
jgi:hypothetical protein